jgi:hypothetical protein
MAVLPKHPAWRPITRHRQPLVTVLTPLTWHIDAVRGVHPTVYRLADVESGLTALSHYKPAHEGDASGSHAPSGLAHRTLIQ